MPSTAPTATASPVSLALDLAAAGWHVFPLTPRDKRPLANCLDCRDNPDCPADEYTRCRCIGGGQWCHGVRAATTDPGRITTWWRRVPAAIPAVAAGPSGLVLIDLDHHTDQPPADPAARLLPGLTLTENQIPGGFAAVRDGADVLRLLARLRGGPNPWPADPAYQPVSVATPSGGRHLWYRAPAIPTDKTNHRRLRQALGELGWQIDIKAAWSYGIAPGATTRAGTYTIRAGALATVGQMPGWLTREVLRVTAPRREPPPPPSRPAGQDRGRAVAYLHAVIEDGAAELAPLTDGRKAALSALAYKTGGLLAWAGQSRTDVQDRLVQAGIASGLPERLARRIVHRALTNGLARPLPAPHDRHTSTTP
ncbi:bifunctional DNA primase/polymerase [Spirillospora sp. CA-142024]|uniref:bifunctional DNA primase/polymerase n=1 Tax=Spirillospora sp. CA-142024 TaxID=3240036 RepID=UPI003D93EA7C